MIGRISSVVFFLLLFVSCSLKYTEEEVSVKGIPEIVFTNAKETSSLPLKNRLLVSLLFS